MSPFSLRSFSFSLLVAGAIGLSGCAKPYPTIDSAVFAPGANITGKGYTYHDNTPLSSPARTDYWHEDIAFDSKDTKARTESWRYAVGDMVSRVLDKRVLPTGPIYLKTKERMDPYNIAFDHYLREALQAHGMYLTTNPHAPYVIHFHASEGKATLPYHSYNDLIHRRKDDPLYDDEKRTEWEEDQAPYEGIMYIAPSRALRLSLTAVETRIVEHEVIETPLVNLDGYYDMLNRVCVETNEPEMAVPGMVASTPQVTPPASVVLLTPEPQALSTQDPSVVVFEETSVPQAILPRETQPQPQPVPVEIYVQDEVDVMTPPHEAPPVYSPMTYQVEPHDAVVEPLE